MLEIELQNRSMELAAVSQSKVLDSTVQKLVKHIDNSPLAVLEWDRFLRVSKWSRQAEDIFGWHADEVIGKTLLEWQFIHEDDVARVTSSLDAMIQSKEPSVIIHNKNYKKDGSVADCFWYNSILFDENGEILSVLSLVQDETARVTAESQLLQANQVLELRVKQRTAELEQKQAMLNVILDTINVGIVAADASGKLTLFNRATKKLHGIDNLNVSQDEWAKYYKLLELDGSKVLNTSDVPLSRALRGELVDHQQFVIESVNGLQRIISASGQSFSDSHGNPLGAVVAMHDITDEKKIELELIAKQALPRSITDSIPVGVAYVDKHQRYQYCNPQYHRIYNRDITAIVGNTKREVFGEAIYKTLESFIQAALMGEMVAIERQQTINDHVIYLDVRFIPDKSVTGEVIGFYVMVWDVTDQKRREMEFQRQASIDPLTGVYNKSFITELLKQEIKKQQETRKNIAIMFLDIDYFKKINDQYGHLIGDEVIKFFAAQVRASIRKIDYIGRFGGDEFLLVISDINSLASAERIAGKILASVATPFKVGALTLQLSTSVGIAFSKNSASGNLVKLADEALYEAKAAGRGNFKSKELS
ncbi:diguanylate cyclase [Methylophilus sp. 3sh_L]|uniref:GGDEF domain-containing protein n=1 Tax=Methylophilus sp. 3sh_L TaxID=3377114 RepID=UPI00398EACAE